MSKFIVRYVIHDDSTILRTFDTKEEAVEWAKDNFRTYTRDGGIVSVITCEEKNQTGNERWRIYEVFQ